MSIEFSTFGCKVNTYDTGLLQGQMKEFLAGDQFGSQANIHVLNSCAVTSEASQQAARQVRRIRREDPEAVVIVTGCAAQVDPDIFHGENAPDLLVANSHKEKIADLLKDWVQGDRKKQVHRALIFRNQTLGAGGGLEEDHTRSFLKIQDGCNSFCSFCVIPYARGTSRSLDADQLLKSVDDLVAKGIQEVVLTGVHIADYQDPDSKMNLTNLVEHLLSRTQIKRLRLSSLEPGELTPGLLDLFSDSRLCPHFHMSIQSADTDVLKAMKRSYDAKAVEKSLQEIAQKVPGAFVGMDVIAGFPTESASSFERSLELLKRTPWSRIHVFPYSERSGTTAAQMPQLPMSLRKERASILRKLSEERLIRTANSNLGLIKKALVLRSSESTSICLSRDYWRIHADVDLSPMIGREVDLKIKAVGELSPNGQVELRGEWVAHAS